MDGHNPVRGVHVETAGDTRLFFPPSRIPPAGIVELQISASRLVKGRDGLLIGGGDVRKEACHCLSIALKGLVLLIPDGGNEVKHGRGGNGELGWRVPASVCTA